jgi:uncharacterized protein YgbK (DUF1537 family)
MSQLQGNYGRRIGAPKRNACFNEINFICQAYFTVGRYTSKSNKNCLPNEIPSLQSNVTKVNSM